MVKQWFFWLYLIIVGLFLRIRRELLKYDNVQNTFFYAYQYLAPLEMWLPGPRPSA